MSTPAVPTEAVEAANRAIARALLPYEDDDDASVFEWHECDGCPNLPDPCPCSGQPWIKAEIAEAVAAAVLATVDVRKAQAQAWDEGVRRCDQAWHEGDAVSVFDRNPYRENGADDGE